MITCFLSHSSTDKLNFVQIVADRLPKEWRVYDQDTFEAGMQTFQEILRTLESSGIFVLFISNASLNSEWVRKEITEAKRLEIAGSMRKFYPIVIDPTVLHTDPRIPEWMRDEYNLRAVVRPTQVARRIHQRIRELAWEIHPRLKERQRIFVGRNEEIKNIEERFDDYERQQPVAVICAGLQRIGRKKLMQRGLIKAAQLAESYVPAQITLTQLDSIEDFILRILDLGVVDTSPITIASMSMDQKIKFAAELCKKLQSQEEIVVIEDAGAIIGYDRKIAPWFVGVLEKLAGDQKTCLAIASRFRAEAPLMRRDDIYYITLAELSLAERMGLFKRVAEFESLDLKTDDFAYFKNLLHGFPEQVFYAVTLIKDLGLPMAKKKTELLIEFNSDRAASLVDTYAPLADEKEFLYLLSEFDFISFDFLESLVDLTKFSHCLEKFLAGAICETLGSNGEYIRLNDSIRDYMRRSRVPLPADYEQKLRNHARELLQDFDADEVDASEYLFTMQRALVSGANVNSRFLIPSHFLKAMKELYDRHRKYREVVILADRVLADEEYLDENISREIRHFLCLSLARTKNPRFLEELQNIKGPEHTFLLGFYYRMCGRTSDAIAKQLLAVKEVRTASRARRELVQLYVNIEEFDTALALAEKNYSDRPSNPFHIQAYLKCLINSSNWRANQPTIVRLLEALRTAENTFERATEMRMTAEAQYLAYCLNDLNGALHLIDEAIHSHPNNPYPILTKISILFRDGQDVAAISALIKNLETQNEASGIWGDAMLKAKAQLHYLQGRKEEGDAAVQKYIRNVPDNTKIALASRIKAFRGDLSANGEDME